MKRKYHEGHRAKVAQNEVYVTLNFWTGQDEPIESDAERREREERDYERMGHYNVRGASNAE